MKRTANSIRNSLVGIMSYVMLVLVNFVSRRIFFNVLGSTYLGLNGLFTNIIAMLSLTELGIGTAIIYSLYRPIAEKNYAEITSIVHLIKRIYRVIGAVITVIGFCVMPFLQYLMKDDLGASSTITMGMVNAFYAKNIIPMTTVRILFFIHLADTVFSYFFSYKRTILTADQQNYIITAVTTISKLILTFIQIGILLKTANYILYMAIQVCFNACEHVIISKIVDRKYPYLKGKKNVKIRRSKAEEIITNVKALFLHKIGTFVVNSTDNLVISAFVGVTAVGLYSNYSLVFVTLNNIITQIFSAITSSMGNLFVEDSRRAYSVFKIYNFLDFWIHAFSSVCLIVLMEPFLVLIFGSKALMSTGVLYICVANFYATGMRKSITATKDSAGLYTPDKYVPIFQAVTNIVVSLILVQFWGTIGVFVGTLISTLAFPFWIQPMLVYHSLFKRSSASYFKSYFTYTALTAIMVVLVHFLCTWAAPTFSFLNFIVRILICLVVPNVIIIGLFHKTSECRYLLQLAITIMKRIGQKLFHRHA